MDLAFLAGAVLLVGATVFVVLEPLLTGRRALLVREHDEPTEAEARRRVALLALRDVEYDHATGKLDEADYADLRRELSAEALDALEQADLEERDDPDTRLEEEIARVRAGLREGTTCEACGYVNRAGSRFCSRCGGPLPVADAASR